MEISKHKQRLAFIFRKPFSPPVIAGALVVLVLTFVLIFFAGNRKSVEFDNYRSNLGGFYILAPEGKHDLISENFTVADKSTTRFIHQFILSFAKFTVTHFDLPPVMITPKERNTIFHFLAEDYMSACGASINSSKTIKFNGYSGMRIIGDGELEDKNILSEVVIIQIANRFFVVGVYGERKYLKQRHIDTFIDSFTMNL